MIAINNTDLLNKILYNELLTQSELPKKRVLNAITDYGVDLQKQISPLVFESLDKTDCVVLFQLFGRSSTNNKSMTEDDDSITYYKSYELKLILYGNDGTDYANKIVARFRTENCRNNLLSQGVYLEQITYPETINEFINGSMWIRNDVSIYIGCKFTFNQINNVNKFEEISNLKIINKEE